MNEQPENSNIKKSVRRGTAKRQLGKETATRLVKTAFELLQSENLDQFSMRSVAKRAGVKLANVQYYYPRREDLTRALSHYLEARYRAAYEECASVNPDSPLERLKTVISYNLKDCTDRSSRRFFIQFWALLGSLDDFKCEHLGELYALDIAMTSEYIRALDPSLPEEEIERRSILIIAIIEGLIVMSGAMKEEDPKTKSLLQSAKDLMLDIARGK